MVELTGEQRSAVEMVKTNDLSILTGGPGTGKTTTCNEIISWAYNQGKMVGLCAPSGKAAKRISEATGFEASIMHKLLEAHLENGVFVFGYDAANPLPYDLLICDEASMVSTDLMASFLSAVRQGAKVLFVGDQDQLPSVGPGAVLRDLLASATIPHIELTKIHRNAGHIVRCCHKIKQGRSYSPSPKLVPEEGLNLRHVEVRNESQVVETIRKLVAERMPARGYDPVWDVQVISPLNERTSMSCKALNEVLQQDLNQNPPFKDRNQKVFPFRKGDKAIQIKNERVKTVGGEEDYVVNGDLCRIKEVNSTSIIAEFFDPGRTVTLSKTDHHLLLAYAITCHRFQGSEAPVIIIPVHKSFGFFINRPWIYTAISRAREICITVGQFAAISNAITREGSNKRLTRLKEKLRRWEDI